MTFYWWSHWFWITFISNLWLLSTIVHTYPSQEVLLENNPSNKVSKLITKLYKTETTIDWGTIDSTTAQVMDLTERGLLRPDNESVENQDSEELEITDQIDGTPRRNYDNSVEEEISRDFEFKRSAEIKESLELSKNNSNEGAIKIIKKPTITMTEDDSLGTKIINDHEMLISSEHGNYSVNNISNLSTNKTTKNNSINSTIDLLINQSAPSAPSTPIIDTKPSAAEWFKSIVAQLPPSVSQHNVDDIASNMVTTSYGTQKIPFTLENVNREEELRRAENEHRTRKSKVLSAEYKQINRYINFSSDPRSLLTRSASASPNDFDSDSGNNISSEALSIQRTYFLDAGAISAICLTVFGVCCTVGTISIVLYRRRYLNKPQTLSEPDSSVYIDDSTMRVSDNSDEMYSLDNDSFLNSLEAMTIQNYWTDTVKHTKL